MDLNRSNPAYIRPIDKEIEEVLDPKQNKAFRHGELARWILKDRDDWPIGRIAAFVNKGTKTRETMFRSAVSVFLIVSITRKLRICCWM